MPGKIYPTEKGKLMSLLTPDVRQIIQRDYPFKKKRNEKIYELIHQKGVSGQVLASLCGLSRASVHRIGQRGYNGRYLTDNEKNLRNDLIKIQAAVEAFHREIKKILRHGRK